MTTPSFLQRGVSEILSFPARVTVVAGFATSDGSLTGFATSGDGFSGCAGGFGNFAVQQPAANNIAAAPANATATILLHDLNITFSCKNPQ
jgi:hypothetical protein